MSPDFPSSLVVLLITGLGFAGYLLIAQRRKTSRVEEFFLAGRNIGFPLFTQTTWGNSFAFGNSIFYAVWLGYTVGLLAIWIQALWAIGMICYALLLPRLITFTERHTLHGFLGWRYGTLCRLTASLVSTIGFLILLGFEVSFVAQYFSHVTNLQHMEWLVVLAVATFIATFCTIGGYKANVITDRITNFIAVSALLGLLALIVYKHGSSLADGFSPSALWTSATDYSSQNGMFLFGMTFFALFNFVDMTNWQNVSANSLDVDLSRASQDQRKRMQWAMLKAAGLFLFAPVLTGTFLGYMLKVLALGTTDQSIFMSTMVLESLPTEPVLAVSILSLLTFAFMASSLAGADSWLLAVTQTLSWDVIDYDKFKAVGFSVRQLPPVLHEEITRRARLILLMFGIGGAAMVYYISTIWGEIFGLQFVIFGGGLAMLPSLLFGIFTGNPPQTSRTLQRTAVLSIVLGYGAAFVVFVYSLIMKEPDLVSPLPPIALGVAAVVLFSVLVIGNLRRLN